MVVQEQSLKVVRGQWDKGKRKRTTQVIFDPSEKHRYRLECQLGQEPAGMPVYHAKPKYRRRPKTRPDLESAWDSLNGMDSVHWKS